jgi:anhydro-N-acetylmuramic acid kinase
MRIAGIMSGTSLDGIDVAIIDLTSSIKRFELKVLGFRSAAYPKSVRAALLAVSNCATHTREIARLHFLLAELYSEAFYDLCRAAEIDPASVQLIGCHGQTIFHEGLPVNVLGRRIASTLQIGDGSVLAERTGISVVSDFRPRDIAAGGAGAPLVPYVDYLLYRNNAIGRVALNIGGIANVTVIPKAALPGDVLAFDTGPGNMVIDQLAAHYSGGKRCFDRGGAIAARGTVNGHLLDELMRDPFYRRKPPKTAGREQFGSDFVSRILKAKLRPEDALATATALTAASIAEGVTRYALISGPMAELIVSGGGVHNRALMSMLQRDLPEMRVVSCRDVIGMDPDAKEAIAFAILAHETWHGRASSLPSATGARHPVILGKIGRIGTA